MVRTSTIIGSGFGATILDLNDDCLIKNMRTFESVRAVRFGRHIQSIHQWNGTLLQENRLRAIIVIQLQSMLIWGTKWRSHEDSRISASAFKSRTPQFPLPLVITTWGMNRKDLNWLINRYSRFPVETTNAVRSDLSDVSTSETETFKGMVNLKIFVYAGKFTQRISGLLRNMFQHWLVSMYFTIHLKLIGR